MSEDPVLNDACTAPEPAVEASISRWRAVMIGKGWGDMVDALPPSWSESITRISVILQEHLAREASQGQALWPDERLQDVAAPLVSDCLTQSVSLVDLQAALFALKDVLSETDRHKGELFFERLSLAVLQQWQEQQDSLWQQVVVTDGLTTLYNRRYLEEYLERELARARRYKHILTLVLINIDGFKPINDKHGPATGDRVLQHLAQLMRQQFRQPDILARLGGDGFAVILTECLLPDAQRVCERFRKKAAESSLALPDGQQLGITVSIGMAQFYPGIGAEELFKKADRALYRAKLEGKNRVYVQRD